MNYYNVMESFVRRREMVLVSEHLAVTPINHI